jgi:predicted permease
MATLFQDLRYGLRLLAKNPAFALLIVLTLGLGIGVNTIIFDFVNALLLRPPAVQASSRLLELWQRNPKAPGLEEYVPLTYPDYVYYRDRNQVFAGLLAFDGEMRPVSWSRGGEGQMVQGQLVSGNFFSVLGLAPALGRFFLPEEDQLAGGQPVVVLSRPFWKIQFADDPAVLGKTLVLNGTSFTVVGVAPASFTGIVIGNEPDFWAPLSTTTQFTRDNSFLTSEGSFWLFGIGRLKPGVSPSQAQANLKILSGSIQQSYPQNHKDLEAATFRVTLVPEPFRGYVAAFTGLLMVVVGLVLMIACANAANLLLAQATGRRREMAIRAALGAGRVRLLRQMLIESSIVAVLGGSVAVLLTKWATPALLALKPPSLPIRLEVHLDWRVLTFTFATSIATAILFGLAPALRTSRTDASLALKEEGLIGGLRSSRLRSALVVAQIAVCLVLLISAGLCLRSLINAKSLDPGFDTRHVALAVLDPGSLGYSEVKGRIYYQQLLSRVEALPGVSSASLASHLPLTTGNWTQEITIEGHKSSPGSELSMPLMTVGPQFFATMGIPLERGREFTEQDSSPTPSVVIINTSMAAQFWPGQDPIGRHFKVIEQDVEIIGVAKTGKYRTLGEDPQPFMYLPIGYRSRTTLVVRTAGDPRSLLPALRHELQALDPNVVPFDLETIQEYMALPMFPARSTALLLGAFGLLALVLAVAGLYGVMSCAVSQRTREMGVRMALGAADRDLLKLVVGHGLRLTLVGLACGLLGAFALTRVLASLLYGIRPTDPFTFVIMPLLLALVTTLASYIPARRATKVDPMAALRYQ